MFENVIIMHRLTKIGIISFFVPYMDIALPYLITEDIPDSPEAAIYVLFFSDARRM